MLSLLLSHQPFSRGSELINSPFTFFVVVLYIVYVWVAASGSECILCMSG